MAIYHCQIKVVSRSTGRSSVAASAYRSGTTLKNEREGHTYDFSRRSGVVHSEIVVPKQSKANWALDRSALWNAVEAVEKRKDSRVAREFEIALPHELGEDQRLELTRKFSNGLAEKFGTAVDFAIHKPDPRGSEKNHHAHVMMTTRRVDENGLGEKTLIEWENKKLLQKNLPTTQLQMKEVRLAWELAANDALERAGFDVRIDHRSNKDRGLEIEPTRHVGVHATAVQRDGVVIDRERVSASDARANAQSINAKPEQIIDLLSGEKSVFTKEDIARTLHRYIHDDAEAYQGALARVMSAPELMRLRSDVRSDIERYTTREMFALETEMIEAVGRLSADRTHRVEPSNVAASMRKQDAKIYEAVSRATADKVARGEISEADRAIALSAARLSPEQRQAIEHVTADNRLALVVGVAGAGKSTMLEAAREAWEAQGYRVHGAALSGKASSGLRESSGIESRTLASWQHRWKLEKSQIGKGDVFVIDEAGMVGSRQLARFIGEVEERGAKIVLVGDHEQLQSIGAGAAFRAIGERSGFAELVEVRRQRDGWQAEATVRFSKQQTGEALRAYKDHGGIAMEDTRETARTKLVADYLNDVSERPDGSRVILAHQRVDVQALNREVRSGLQERGALARGEEAGELVFQTDEGKRAFAQGDRIVFLENNDRLGVMNGTLGTVEAVKGGQIVAKLDNGTRVEVPTDQYTAFDHGYATTIHKSQGDTVDRAFVLATSSMDRHTTYVAMTRHRDTAQLYASREDFERGGGRLIAHGRAPFENNPDNRASYFVTLANSRGQRETHWGVDLERAMGEAKASIGDRIALRQVGRQDVTLPDGTKAHRNTWEVSGPDELTYRQMERQLGRDGSKEITLDYVPMPAADIAAERAASRIEEAPSNGLPSSEREASQRKAAILQAGLNRLKTAQPEPVSRRIAYEAEKARMQQERPSQEPMSSSIRQNMPGEPAIDRKMAILQAGLDRLKPMEPEPINRRSAYEAEKARMQQERPSQTPLPTAVRETTSGGPTIDRKAAYAAAKEEKADGKAKVGFGKSRGATSDGPSKEAKAAVEKFEGQPRLRPSRRPEWGR